MVTYHQYSHNPHWIQQDDLPSIQYLSTLDPTWWLTINTVIINTGSNTVTNHQYSYNLQWIQHNDCHGDLPSIQSYLHWICNGDLPSMQLYSALDPTWWLTINTVIIYTRSDRVTYHQYGHNPHWIWHGDLPSISYNPHWIWHGDLQSIQS